MRVPKHIRQKMRRVASLTYDAAVTMKEIEAWLISKGIDPESVRDGDGYSLEELEYGNDVTDELCERLEKL